MGYVEVYNNTQALLWFGGLVMVILSLVTSSARSNLNKYFMVVQSIMVLDIVHAALKVVKGNIIATIIQVASRIAVVLWILPRQKELLVWNFLMFTAWSLAEIIRYRYYVNKSNKILVWLRYNAFIVLYPIGILTGEMPLIYKDYKVYGGKFNLIALSLYIPGFPFLFIHMLKLRKKNTQAVKNE